LRPWPNLRKRISPVRILGSTDRQSSVGNREEKHEVIGASVIPSEFNDFLFAPIGEQETALSVLSALARLDVDPWQEAARLAQLPKYQAIQDLGSMTGGLRGGRWKVSETNMIAARLVGLLPPRKNASADNISCRIILSVALMSVIFVAVCGVIVVGSHLPPSSTSHAVIPVSNAVAAQLPPSPHSE
jgi:hypothetical protein